MLTGQNLALQLVFNQRRLSLRERGVLSRSESRHSGQTVPPSLISCILPRPETCSTMQSFAGRYNRRRGRDFVPRGPVETMRQESRGLVPEGFILLAGAI